jgi:hypothetical protein
MTRVYGKPEETVRQVEVNPATVVLKSMSLDEKLDSSSLSAFVIGSSAGLLPLTAEEEADDGAAG